MNIHENTALLDAFVDGELTAGEMAEVQAHLDNCPDCRAYVDDALAIRAALSAENDWAIPADFKENVMEAVAKTPQSRPRKQPWGKLVAAAACLAVIVLVQHGAGGGAEAMDAAAAYAADCTVEESAAVERSMDAPAETDDAEIPAALWDSAAYTASAKQEANGATTAAETASGTENTPVEETEDEWVEGPGGNVVFSCTVYLMASDVGDALDGFEGKPFSTTGEPEKGIIGIGYAMEPAAFEHILYDVLNRPAEVGASDPTTELCCIVVTED